MIDDLINQLTQPEILPRGGRLVLREGPEVATFVVEQEPMVRTLRWGGYHPAGDGKERLVRLPLPFVVALVKIATFVTHVSPVIDKPRSMCCSTLEVYFRNKPLGSLDDALDRACLPNVQFHNTVCLGDLARAPYGLKTFSEAVEAVMAAFWNTSFYYWYDPKRYHVVDSESIYFSRDPGRVPEAEDRSDHPLWPTTTRAALQHDWGKAIHFDNEVTLKSALMYSQQRASARVRGQIVHAIYEGSKKDKKEEVE
jgi:hypothetical protein